MSSQTPPLDLFPARELRIGIPSGFPAVHEAYRGRRDQKDMLCGPYTLAYLLRAYGFDTLDGVPITADSVAAAAGTALEEDGVRRTTTGQAVTDDTVPAERVRARRPHGHYEYPLGVADEGGCSPKGLVEACRLITDGDLAAIPVPAVRDGEVQLDGEGFEAVLSAALDESFAAQLVFNYNLRHTLAPTGLLGHRYNPLALFANWDEPDYFRRLDWDVGHFTSLAGRVTRTGSDRRYLLIRDSYRSFGWNGYHLQPGSYVRDGVVRDDDDRDGGVILLTPSECADDLETYLARHGLAGGLWDNGSPYLPHTDPFS